MSRPTLTTFPPSLDSELARFLLLHYGIAYVETPHTLIFSSLSTLREGFTVRFPLLHGESYSLSTVRRIIDHFDPLADESKKLFPAGALHEDIESDWDLFHDDLAWATATFAYYHLLPHRELMIAPFTAGVPASERRAVELAYPVFAGLLKLLLRLTSSRADAALERIRSIVARVDTRIADGRRYLLGDRLTLADVSFAVAIGPVLLPEKYGGPLPPLRQMPAALREVVAEVRGHAAGVLAQRIYREHRLDG